MNEDYPVMRFDLSDLSTGAVCLDFRDMVFRVDLALDGSAVICVEGASGVTLQELPMPTATRSWFEARFKRVEG